MSLAHFIFEMLEFLPDIFPGGWSAVACPHCGVEVQLLQRKAKLYRCPACEKLWVKINKKLEPFISSHQQ